MRITLRNFRVIIALALGRAVAWATAPYATSYVSSQAVVNAPLNIVVSPMRGRITQRSPPIGTRVAEIDARARDRSTWDEDTPAEFFEAEPESGDGRAA